MTDTQTEPLDAAAITFQLLGKFIYEEPTEELISELLDPDFFADIPYRGNDEKVTQGITLLQEWSTDAQDKDLTEVASNLNSEWLKLFVGYGTPKAPPWMSYYFEKDPMVFGQKTLEVRAWFARYGLESDRKYHEPDDHLGLMLQFLAVVIDRECDAELVGDTEAAAACQADEATFMQENLLSWVSHWQDLVSERAKEPFYKGIALLIDGSVRSFAGRF